jgi:ABC-type glycerol-3-phosphate transport system substrate-binding protein
MSAEPKKVDRRKFLYAGLGAAIIVLGGATLYLATKPAETITSVSTSTATTTATTATTISTTTTVPTTSVTTTTVPTTTTITTAPTTTTTPEAVKIHIYHHHWDPITRQAFDQLRTKFEELTNIKTETTFYPWAEYRINVIRALAAGEAPDVIHNDCKLTVEWAEMGALEPLDDLLAEHPEVSKNY